jgi:hypothetical protein
MYMDNLNKIGLLENLFFMTFHFSFLFYEVFLKYFYYYSKINI